jgi:Glycosyl transferase family 2
MNSCPVNDEPRAISVTVLVATYNRAGYIDECLQNMLMQTCPPDEILVVDDGSTDETSERVASYGQRVRYVRKENGGRSSAINEGLRHANGEWLWLFDDDDVPELDALERFKAALASDPQADFAYSGQIIGVNGPDGRIVRRNSVRAPEGPPEALFQRALSEYPFRTQGALIHRRCFARVGAFDVRYARSQDYEFVLRMLRRCRGVRLDRPTFVWRVHEGPRGPAHARHDGAQRGEAWMNYASMLGRQLRAELPLEEYVWPTPPASIDAARLRRQSLLQRMNVMASKGLLDEAFEDLAAAADQGMWPLDAAEFMACWKSATHEYFLTRWMASPQVALQRRLELARRAPARAMIAALGRGLLYAGRHATADRKPLLVAALRLLWAAHRPRLKG